MIKTKFYTIYKITHKDTGQIYIGKHITKDLNDRYMGSGKRISRAVAKYGRDAFEKEYLFIFDNEIDMNLKEAEIVTEDFCIREDTFNLCVGGKGGFSYINRDGSKRRMELMADPEWNAKYKEALRLGREKMSPEASALMKQRRIDTLIARYGKVPSNWEKGQKHRPETIELLKRRAQERDFVSPTEGKRWMFNEDERVLVPKNEVEEYEARGFRLGRHQKSEKVRSNAKVGGSSKIARFTLRYKKILLLEKWRVKHRLKKEMLILFEKYQAGASLRALAMDLPYSYKALQMRFKKAGFNTDRKTSS
jgi:hypothetical protein